MSSVESFCLSFIVGLGSFFVIFVLLMWEIQNRTIMRNYRKYTNNSKYLKWRNREDRG